LVNAQMEIEIVNLSRVDGDGGPLPIGQEPFHGKFVLVADDRRIWLVYGSLASFPYHAHLVGRFCEDKMLACGWVRPRDHVEIYDPNFRIHGGGQILIDSKKKLVRFAGTSKAYGTYDESRLRQVVEAGGCFDGFAIRMD
jgi:hypothetical protein